ncbi:HIT family hydrolase [Vibrio sp. qd031]|uniref:HIT domain-containing protein n=1 Tax=Vibrio sp. qd031 TaxID=1603038 RepID=UPI000A11EFC8|nr:HIT family protein [Vibrio sp. qd031]ORT50373.1 HIT family hydrolase [Vibrio sp. qd031]
MSFALHPKLHQDTTLLGEFPLSLALLIKDDAAPWVVLVPKLDNIKELHHLTVRQQQQLLSEVQTVSQTLEAIFQPDKLNIGALGNLVPQFHFHVVARFNNDIAWPGPIWGNTQGRQRDEDSQSEMVDKLTHALSRSNQFRAI